MSADIQEFTTAAEASKRDKEGGIPFKFDQRMFKCYKPDETQMAFLMASVGRGASDTDRIAGVINFFCKVMDEESASYFEQRLLDSEDGFGIADVDAIMRWMVKAWTGNPTNEPSGSTQSQPNSGQGSTPTTSLLT